MSHLLSTWIRLVLLTNGIKGLSKSAAGIHERTSEWPLVTHCFFPWESCFHKGLAIERAWSFLPRVHQFKPHPVFLEPGYPVLCAVPSRCTECRRKPHVARGWSTGTNVHSGLGGSNRVCLLSNAKEIPALSMFWKESWNLSNFIL